MQKGYHMEIRVIVTMICILGMVMKRMPCTTSCRLSPRHPLLHHTTVLVQSYKDGWTLTACDSDEQCVRSMSGRVTPGQYCNSLIHNVAADQLLRTMHQPCLSWVIQSSSLHISHYPS
jgi:hypothetical protein